MCSSDLGIQVGIDQQIGYQDVFAWQAFEPPGWETGGGPVNIFTVLQQAAQEVGPDESARTQHQDRALKLADIGGTGLVECDDKIAVIDSCKNLAGLNTLVVDDQNFGQIA